MANEPIDFAGGREVGLRLIPEFAAWAVLQRHGLT
jgi:hypothetical protein